MASSYDADGMLRRGSKWFVFFVSLFLAVTFTVVMIFHLFIGPYRSFRYERTIEYEAHEAHRSSPSCRDPVLRAATGTLSGCALSERFLSMPLEERVLHDLMNHLKICKDGVCNLFGINITASVWSLLQIVLAFVFFTWVVSALGMCLTSYGRSTAMYQLPYAGPPKYYHHHHQVPVEVCTPNKEPAVLVYDGAVPRLKQE